MTAFVRRSIPLKRCFQKFAQDSRTATFSLGATDNCLGECTRCLFISGQSASAAREKWLYTLTRQAVERSGVSGAPSASNSGSIPTAESVPDKSTRILIEPSEGH
jgi:hypothetical protein